MSVRDPVRVDSMDDGPTSPHSAAATGTDVRVAARALQSPSAAPTLRRSDSARVVVVGGGLLLALLVVLAVSVIWVSHDAKHPLVQPNPPAQTTSAPTPTATAGPIPLPATTAQVPPSATPTAPVEAMPPSQVTAETMTPAPPPTPRHRRLRDLFPQLFPSG
jgi:hypothetical protein